MCPYCLYFSVLLRCFRALEVFPCSFLSCKANAKTEHGPHSSTLVCICVVRLLFVLFYVLFVCKCVLPPGDNPIAVNIYIYILTAIGLSPDGSTHLHTNNAQNNTNNNRTTQITTDVELWNCIIVRLTEIGWKRVTLPCLRHGNI